MKHVSWILMLSSLALAAGCPVPQDQNTPVWQRLETDPVTGQGYYMYVPSTYTPEKPVPLIVTCHGSPPWDIAEHHIREWKKLGEDYGCIVLAPQLRGTDGIVGNGPVADMIEDEKYVLSLVSMVGYRYNVDLNNILLTGFSGGGFPVYFIGLRNPDVFSCMVLRSCDFFQGNLEGWFSADLAERALKPSIMVYWGENDPGPIRDQSEKALKFLANCRLSASDQIIPMIGHERRPEVAMSFFQQTRRVPRSSQSIRR